MENKKIKLGISLKNYKTKPNFGKIKYNTQTISEQSFIEKIKEGYCFTHCMKCSDKEYGVHEKTIANFHQTNIIWFDFDDCSYSLETAWNKLSIKPSIGYTTISNLQAGKSHRFRLIYLLEFYITSNEDYNIHLNSLLNLIIIDFGKESLKFIDKNCFNVAQQMFGSNQNCEVKTSNDNLFDKEFFSDYKNNNTFINNFEEKICSKKINCCINKKEKKILTEIEHFTTTELIKILRQTNMKDFQPTLTNTNKAILGDCIYSYVEDQYIYEIKSLFSVSDNKYKKVPVGNRTRTLFTFGLITRNIKPEIRLDDLAKNLYWLYINRFEITKDFSYKQVCIAAINAFNENLNNYRELGRRKYIINPIYKAMPKTKKKEELSKAQRGKRDKIVFSFYDSSKSIKENASDINMSENSIRKALKENNVLTPKEQKYISFCVIFNANPSLSIRKLAKITGLSDKTVQAYKKKLLESQKLNIAA